MKSLLIIILFSFISIVEYNMANDLIEIIRERSDSSVGGIQKEVVLTDTIDFEMVSGRKINLFRQIDSLEMVKWTDNYMPQGFVDLKLYSGHLIYESELNEKVQVKTILTFADKWTRLHLITCSQDSNLIDYKEIGEKMEYLLEQTDSFEVYMETDSKMISIGDSLFKIEQIETTTKDYNDDSINDVVLTTVIDSLFIINAEGEIRERL